MFFFSSLRGLIKTIMTKNLRHSTTGANKVLEVVVLVIIMIIIIVDVVVVVVVVVVGVISNLD